MRKPATLVASIVFAAVAAAHALRLAFHLEIRIGGWDVPAWPSLIGVVVPAALSALLWREQQS